MSPESTVLHILVGASGFGGFAGPSPRAEDAWSVGGSVVAHRAEGANASRSALYLCRAGLREAEVRPWIERLPPLTPLRVRVSALRQDAETGAWRGDLVDVLGVSDDAELASIRAELERPVVVEDAGFGTLTLDRRLDRFSGNATWLGAPIGLDLDANDAASLEALLAVAREVFADQAAWQARIEAGVAPLVDLKNDAWLDDDEEPVSREAFLERMRIESVTIGEDGGLTFWHADGDLFWGHSIVVSGRVGQGVTRADIMG